VPFSIVFHCEPQEDFDSRELKGKGLQNFAYGLLDRLSPAQEHRAASVRRESFTASPFFAKRWPSQSGGSCGRKHRRSTVQMIRAGTPCGFRLTLLSDGLSEAVASFVSKPALIFAVNGRSIRVTHVLWTPSRSDPWPRSQTYEQLFDEASSTCKTLRLHFVTPTVFIRHRGPLPLPDPQDVFRGLIESWNRFAPVSLSTDLEGLIDRHVCLKEFRISSLTYDSGDELLPAFTGWGQFALTGRHHEKHIREFNLLADFSFYCGTGDRTEIGMGVTRRL
jgi:CRISPR-associated endoribonuclease Cas6